MKRIIKFLPAAVFFILLYTITFTGITGQEKTYSRMENRTLQGLPEFSGKSFLKGKFQKKYETYLSDQFPKRDSFVKLMSYCDRAMGRTEANGVYFGKDGYLLERYQQTDFKDKRINKNINALKDLIAMTGTTAKVKVMIVPSKTEILRDYLPAFAESYDEKTVYQQLENSLPENTLIPVYEKLHEHRKEEIYYRTDHHWTTHGAWYGYQAYREAVGKKTENASAEKKLKKVSDDFLGTTHSKVNMYSKKDSIYIYEPSKKMKVVYNLGEKTEKSFYQTKYLKEKDKYSIFFGGNQALLEITGGEKNKKTLLVIKDSFANCMIPFLAEDFQKVVVADMRQLNADISMLMMKYRPTDVLVLYNTVQFMQDKEFAMKVKRN